MAGIGLRSDSVAARLPFSPKRPQSGEGAQSIEDNDTQTPCFSSLFRIPYGIVYAHLETAS